VENNPLEGAGKRVAGAYTKASLNKLSLSAEINFEDTHGRGEMTEAFDAEGE
jgi:hypothetical protein